jgi:hypothetical protein
VVGAGVAAGVAEFGDCEASSLETPEFAGLVFEPFPTIPPPPTPACAKEETSKKMSKNLFMT